MKFMETINQHRVLSAATVAVIGLGAIEGIGWAENRTYAVPADSCISPVAASDPDAAPGTNLLFQTQAGMFTSGIVAEGAIPAGAYGVEASFKRPDEGVSAWDKNASRMIKPDRAGHFVLKFALGSDNVVFGVRVVAPDGSPACNKAPEVSYTHKGASDYFWNSGNLPWPNPVSIAVNFLG